MGLRFRGLSPRAREKALARWGYDTVCRAIELGNTEALMFLLTHQANAGKRVNGKGPIMLAVERNDVGLINLLWKYGAPLDTRDVVHRDTALAVAIDLRHFESAEALIGLGAYPSSSNRYGYTVLMCAARSGNERLVRLLIDRGAKLNYEKPRKTSALHEAVVGGNLEVVKMLVEAGAWLYFRDSNGRTPLQLALIIAEEYGGGADAPSGAREIVKYLRLKGSDADKLDAEGDTPLLHALKYGDVEEAGRLILAGADVNARGATLYTPIMWSAGNDYLDITRMLVARGADIFAKNLAGRTAFHFAVSHKCVETLKFLLQAGDAESIAKVLMVKDKRGLTVFALAKLRGWTEEGKSLLRPPPQPPSLRDGG